MEKEKSVFKNMLNKSVRFILIALYLIILISMIAGGISAGSLTLTPSEGLGWTVSKANYLGYMSVCSFAPFSTLLLFGMAVVGFILLLKLTKYLRTKSRNREIYVKVKTLTSKIS